MNAKAEESVRAELSEKPKKRLDKKKKKILLFIIASFTAGALGGIFSYSLLGGDIQNKIAGDIVSRKTIQVEEESATIEAINKINPAVVSITIKGSTIGFWGQVQETKGAGTGFIVDKNGLIITNKHVASDKNAKYSVFTSDGKEYDA